MAVTLRVAYNLALANALQVATGVATKRDPPFLTNDKMPRWVTELQILLVEDVA